MNAMPKYNTTNPFKQTNGENVLTNAVYLGFTLPRGITEETFDPTKHAVIQHFWDEANGREYLPVTRPYQSRSFIPEYGQHVNVGWKYVTYADGSKHLQYFCEAVI